MRFKFVKGLTTLSENATSEQVRSYLKEMGYSNKECKAFVAVVISKGFANDGSAWFCEKV